MKWLILIFLVSCGNQVPKAIDLDDSDGDQISNHLESDYEKYVATYEKLGVVRGVIKHASFKTNGVPFSNYSVSIHDTFKLMTGEELSPGKMDYFSEWKNLSIDFSQEQINPTSDLNLIHIHFEPTTIEPDELVLRSGSFSRSFGKWSTYMKIQLTKEEFQGLITGTHILELKKTFHKGPFQEAESDQTIREKSQKVYIHNGSKVEVIYVSKNIPSQKLHSILGIDSTISVNNDLLFFDSLMTGPHQWFEREIAGQKVFILTTIQDLKQSFHQKLQGNKRQLRRENGVPQAPYQLTLNGKSKVFLKIRSNRIMRTFSESSYRKRYRGGSPRHGGDYYWYCDYYLRKVATEPTVKTTIEDLFDNLNWEKDQKQDFIYEEQIDEQGVFWEISFITDVPHMTLAVSSRPESTYTVTGQYNVKCDDRGPKDSTPAYRTNDENSLSFDIESYVEKIP